MRYKAKLELGRRIRERPTGDKPIVIEAAFGPNLDVEGENPYGRTISDLFARLEGSGVELGQVKWIVIEAGYEKRAERNTKRQDAIPASYFEKYGADGGDLTPDHQHRLAQQGTKIRRVPNEHDDVEKFRADVIAAFEEMFGSWAVRREQGDYCGPVGDLHPYPGGRLRGIRS
jgi:hypothetical protein